MQASTQHKNNHKNHNNRPLPLPTKLPDTIKYILTDFDDTVTSDGALLPETYGNICRAANARLKIIVVTGGCAGWCDHIARTWPVSAVIGEGGGFCIHRLEGRKLRYEFWEDHQIQRDRQKYVLDILRNYTSPDGIAIHLTADQAYRLVDVAIDIGQDIEVPPTYQQKRAIVDHLDKLGIRAKISSIHINAWIGDFDKFAMASRILQTTFNLSAEEMRQMVFAVGDSSNDEPLFQNFPLSAGVANIASSLEHLRHIPTWITEQPGGKGLSEILEKIID